MEETKKIFKGKNPQGTGTTPAESFIIKPFYQPFLGVTISKDTDIDDITEDGKIHQIIKGTTFITEVNDEKEANGIKIKEESKVTLELPEGTILIYQPGTGYTVPEVAVGTIDEVKEELNLLVDKEGKTL